MIEKDQLNALINQIQRGDSTAFSKLTECYKPLLLQTVSSFAQTTVLGSTEREDLEQEATIALYKAAMRFDTAQSQVTFGLYAKICIKNRLISLKRKTERSRKRKAGRKAGEASQAERSKSHSTEAVSKDLLKSAGALLSAFEFTVLKLYISGMRYKDIGQSLGCDRKAVDNALNRGKKKLKGYAEKKHGMNGKTPEE